MLKIGSILMGATFAFLIFVATSPAVFSQTTIFNVPTADTLPQGAWNLEGDLVTKPVRYRDGGFQSYGYRVAYGLNNKTEIGSNFYYSWNGVTSTGQAEFSVKRKIYQNEKHGFSVSAGTVVFVPLRNVGDRTSVMIYGTARKTVNSLNGLTATGGVYSVFRGSKQFGTRTGAIVGLVQPIHKRVSFVADWFSGNNRLGYASAGVNFNITNRQYLLTGYSFGNSGRGNNALAAYYGITF